VIHHAVKLDVCVEAGDHDKFGNAPERVGGKILSKS
jgi:hypothetical protein